MTKNSIALRSVSAAAIVGLTLGLGAPIALAQDAAPVATAPVSLVDSQHAASLTVHKKADPETTGEPTGNVDSNVLGTDLDGVGFTIYKINGLDLTTNEGLAAAANIEAANYMVNGEADLTKATAEGSEEFTDAGGQITWNLTDKLGAYLVVETSPKEGFSPAAPFIAFVPMTQTNASPDQGTTWNYDVVAYPKNFEKKQPEKKVTDSGQNVGDTISYEIKAWAQTIGEGQFRTHFRITDHMDEALAVEAGGVSIISNDKDGAEFVEGSDYTVDVAGQDVSISFTAAGLAKISNGLEIIAKIDAKVATLPEDHIVQNTAKVYENNPNNSEYSDTDPGTPPPGETPKVETYYGDATFKKVAAEEPTKSLEGAEFQVYGAKVDTTCDAAVKDQANLQTANGQDTWISAGTTGDVLIEGLHANDKADMDTTGATTPNEFVKYCLVETKAPVGYELLADPIEFEIKADQVATVTKINGGEIKNLADTTPNLPLTGGAGIGILAAVGAALVGAGAWFARRNSKKA